MLGVTCEKDRNKLIDWNKRIDWNWDVGVVGQE